MEQSTQTPTVYIQQPSSRPIPQNNRNYYNTTNQGYSNPSQFDSYYSVYDEDVELYRDIGECMLLMNPKVPSSFKNINFQIMVNNTQLTPKSQSNLHIDPVLCQHKHQEILTLNRNLSTNSGLLMRIILNMMKH